MDLAIIACKFQQFLHGPQTELLPLAHEGERAFEGGARGMATRRLSASSFSTVARDRIETPMPASTAPLMASGLPSSRHTPRAFLSTPWLAM